MKGYKKLFLCLPLIGCVSLQSPIINAQETEVKVLLNWFPEAEDGGIYEALEEGLYKKVGLDVKVIVGGERPHGQIQIASNEVQFYTGDQISLFRAIANGLPNIGVGIILQKPLTAIITHDNVSSLHDLKGKTLLVSEEGMNSYWPWMKSKYRLSDAQVRPYLGSVAPFLMDNNIAQQGYVTLETYLIGEKHIGYKVFPLSDHGLPGYGEIIETNKNFAQNNPFVVSKFLSATYEGYRDYLKDPAAANKEIYHLYPAYGPKILTFGYNILKKGCYITGPECKVSGIGKFDAKKWAETYSFMKKWKLLTKPLDLSSTFNNSYYSYQEKK